MNHIYIYIVYSPSSCPELVIGTATTEVLNEILRYELWDAETKCNIISAHKLLIQRGWVNIDTYKTMFAKKIVRMKRQYNEIEFNYDFVLITVDDGEIYTFQSDNIVELIREQKRHKYSAIMRSGNYGFTHEVCMSKSEYDLPSI